MCDRILVMSRGEIVGEFAREREFDQASGSCARRSASRGRGMNRICARPADRLPAAPRDGDHLHRRLRLFRAAARQFLQHRERRCNIVKQASFVGVIAVGMTFVLLTGGIDLSVGSNMYSRR